MELEPQDGKFYGKITLDHQGELVAGSHMTLVLTYTAGLYGMDDLGGLKILFRYACDQIPLQAVNPKAEGFISATASNGAKIELSYEIREGERPWYKVLRVRIAGIALKQGDNIIIVLGDKTQGSPGMRLQTFVEPEFEFRTLVDVFSTNVFKYISSPKISLLSGEPVRWRAFLPTLKRLGEPFSLRIRAEDEWGNPSKKCSGTFYLESNEEIMGLPASFQWNEGMRVQVFEGLNVSKGIRDQKVVRIDLLDADKKLLTTANPLVIEPEPPYLHYWGDIHGQSEETIGSNTARRYFKVARDYGFLDVAGHQGNDFQVTKDLWLLINDLSEEFYVPGKFVTIPGYEYSANTALGGDRNVYFLHPNRQIHRSSHELIEDKSDIDTDCLTASDLFEELINDNPDADESVAVFSHAGGRYSDLMNHHDGKLENSVEIHSSWGTFEWLLHDAFKMGYRVGIVANGDGHRGRPGMTYPGASKFGALGGFTCFLSSKLTREDIFYAIKRRHHYATTGERIFIEVKGELNFVGKLHLKDPSLYSEGELITEPCKNVQIGDIVEITRKKDEIQLKLIIKIEANSPIERIEVYNGLDLLKTIHPYLLAESDEDFEKIRVIWEGAEFRARRRNANWNGKAIFKENEIKWFQSFNFWNVDASLIQVSTNELTWNTMTSGNFQGFDVILKEKGKGMLLFESSQVSFELPLSKISAKDTIYEGGGVGKRVRVFKIPEKNPHLSFKHIEVIPLSPSRSKEDRIYLKIYLESGHAAWTSPMYFFKK